MKNKEPFGALLSNLHLEHIEDFITWAYLSNKTGVIYLTEGRVLSWNSHGDISLTTDSKFIYKED